MLTHDLFPYQAEGVRRAIELGGRALIADEPGLGKTFQALAVSAHYNRWPIIVICPATLRLNWAREASKCIGNHVWPHEICVVRNGKDQIPTYAKVIIISYELAVKRILELATLTPGMLILDESHYLKNRKAQRTQKLTPLCLAARCCLLLTGTPVLNRPREIWTSIVALGHDAKFGGYWRFAQKYCAAKKLRFGRMVRWDDSGASNTLELNRWLTDTMMIRRLKKDVLKDLPEKRRIKLVAEGVGRAKGFDLIEQVKRIFEQSGRNLDETRKVLKRMQIEFSEHMFADYARLAEEKAPSALEWIQNNASLESPLVVFGHHQAMLRSIQIGLDAKEHPHALIDGKTGLDDRQKAVDDFQAGKLAVILLSITAASTGITLTRASNMLMAEMPWQPGIAGQAEDRIHRIGQKSAATIWYLIAEGTLDDHLFESLSSKARIVSGLLDGQAVNTLAAEEGGNFGVFWDIVEGILKGLV